MSTTQTTKAQEDILSKVSISFQVTWMILSLLFLGFVINQRLNLFETEEAGARVEHITPITYQKFGGFAQFVTVGIYVNRFHTFDMINNDFVFSGFVWFKFTPGTISIDTLDKFSFIQGEILERSEPETQMIDDQLLATYPVKVHFSSQLNYKDFPLDDHRLRVTLTNLFFSPEEIMFLSSERELVILPKVNNFGWNLVNQVVDTGYVSSAIDPYDQRSNQYHPAAIFAIDYERYGTRFMLTIFLPLLLMFYLSLFSFSLNPYEGMRTAAAGIAAILGYRFVIDRFSPNVGYFMISDYIFFLILSFTWIILIFTILDTYRMHFTAKMKQLLVVIIHILVNTLGTYCLFM